MNFISVIKEMKFDHDEEKEQFLSMATYFERGLPRTLYHDPYEFERLTSIESSMWKRFLKIPQVTHLIESEIAMLSEIKARSALKRLGEDEINTSEVAAVKALLEKSKLLQEKNTEQRTVIFHHIPVAEYEKE